MNRPTDRPTKALTKKVACPPLKRGRKTKWWRRRDWRKRPDKRQRAKLQVYHNFQLKRYGPTDQWTIGPADPRTNGLTDPWSNGHTDKRANGPMDQQTRLKKDGQGKLGRWRVRATRKFSNMCTGNRHRQHHRKEEKNEENRWRFRREKAFSQLGSRDKSAQLTATFVLTAQCTTTGSIWR